MFSTATFGTKQPRFVHAAPVGNKSCFALKAGICKFSSHLVPSGLDHFHGSPIQQMQRIVFGMSKTLEVFNRIVRAIVVDVVNVMTFRNRAVSLNPNPLIAVHVAANIAVVPVKGIDPSVWFSHPEVTKDKISNATAARLTGVSKAASDTGAGFRVCPLFSSSDLRSAGSAKFGTMILFGSALRTLFEAWEARGLGASIA
jgi:hypothetical protein